MRFESTIDALRGIDQTFRDETSTERTVRFHNDLLKHEAFDDIASKVKNMRKAVP